MFLISRGLILAKQTGPRKKPGSVSVDYHPVFSNQIKILLTCFFYCIYIFLISNLHAKYEVSNTGLWRHLVDKFEASIWNVTIMSISLLNENFAT